jgi:peptidyl-dipeptidase A
MKREIIAVTVCLLLSVAGNAQKKHNSEVIKNAEAFLKNYNSTFQKIYYADQLAQWKLNTRIIKGDTATANAADEADKLLAEFTGSKQNIDSAKKYLSIKNKLTPLQVRQFEVVLFNAGNNPQIAANIVNRRIKANNLQTATLYGFKYKLNEKAVTTGYIDSILQNSNDLNERLAAWTASKEVGKTLKAGLDSLQQLRNASVTPLNYKDLFDYNAREYGMGEDDIIRLTREFISQVWPLYRELHTWAGTSWQLNTSSQCPNTCRRIGYRIVGARIGASW